MDPEQFAEYSIGEESGAIEISSADQSRQIILNLARQAREHLYIITHDLTAGLYDHDEVADAFSALIREHRNSEIRIIIRDSAHAVGRNHRLITLCQRLSSRFHLKNPAAMHDNFPYTRVIADHHAYLYRPLESRYEGIANFNDPLEVRQMIHHFRTLWEHAIPDPHTRRLNI